MVTPIFNPSQCLFGTYPAQSKVTVSLGSNNNTVGYLMGVLYCKTGHTNIYIHPNPGPWYFNTTVRQGVIDLQTFFGLTVDGVCGPQTWGAVDYLATH